MVEFVNKNR